MSIVRDFIAVLSGFRKFSIMFLIVLIGIIFRIMGFINGLEFVDLVKGTAIAFFSFNGVEHMTGAIKEFLKKKV